MKSVKTGILQKVSPEVLQGAWAAEPCPWPAVRCSAEAAAAVAATDLPKYTVQIYKLWGRQDFHSKLNI